MHKILNNLGSLLEEMDDLLKARSYFERALEIRRKVLGERHPDTAKSYLKLALLNYPFDHSDTQWRPGNRQQDLPHVHN